MRVEYINPFISAVQNTFKTMLDCDVHRGVPVLKEGICPRFEVSGIIGLSGLAIGTVVLSLSESVALKAASTMLMCETSTVDNDVIDAVGELTNMVAGSAKAKLSQYSLMVSLPNVIIGQNVEIRFPSNVTPISVPFTSPWGGLTLDVGLVAIAEPIAQPIAEPLAV